MTFVIILYLLYFLVPIVAVVIGFRIGGRSERKWKIALGLLLAPPALVALFYALASQGGCAGGTCMGPMIGLLFLGGLAALVMLVGVGIVLRAVFSALTA